MIKPTTALWQTSDYEVRSTLEVVDSPLVERMWVGTLAPGQSLSMKTADCLPVVIVDEALGVLGFAHIGWKELLGNRVSELTQALQQAGAHLDQVRVFLGPAICSKCYCDPGLKGWLKSLLFRSRKLAGVVGYQSGMYHFDLSRALSIQLERHGVRALNINDSGVCNFEAGLPSRRRNGRRGVQLITVVSRKAI
jgi:copper oxidase (laccase) domain-containing protein